MAQKRMFSLNVVDTDRFLEMPITSRLLYYELGMRADDDGFVDNWKKIMLFTGLKEDDLKILIAKSFIIPFESGVIVIKHWRMNNYLQNDRKKMTSHQDELEMLDISSGGEYFLKQNTINKGLETICIQDTNKVYTQYSIDKYSIDNNIYNQNNNFDSEFENLWKIYPKKQGKKNAKKSYIKARKSKVAYNDILNGLNNYLEYIKNNKVSQQYIKQGSTWFNQECWNDEYDITKANVPTWFNNQTKEEKIEYTKEEQELYDRLRGNNNK